MSKKVLLTFDYEIFMGGGENSVLNCLILPTNRILEILEKNHSKAIFFVDTAFLYKLNQEQHSHEKIKQDFELIKQQLIYIAQSRHYICHHLHPHWIDAQYIPQIHQWDLSNQRYYNLHDMPVELAETLFKFSHEFISDILNSAKIKQQWQGFRAGGLMFHHKFTEPFLLTYNIEYDFSTTSPIEYHKIFTNCDSFKELPISEVCIQGITKIANGVWFRITKHNHQYQMFGEGIASNPHQPNNESYTQSKLSMRMPISVEMLTPTLLPFVKYQLKKHKYIHFLSHPKLQSPKSITMLDKFLHFCNKQNVEFDFEKIAGIKS